MHISLLYAYTEHVYWEGKQVVSVYTAKCCLLHILMSSGVLLCIVSVETLYIPL